ncbi:MAG: hypothetical protein Kow0065_08830 [Methylomicrobium sp.]
MNRKLVYLSLAVLTPVLTACTPPAKDISGLKSEMDAAVAGHYGQALYHWEVADEKFDEANHILGHWQNDHYWNIDERQKAMDAAREAAQHRLASEKALCSWLTSVHSHNHDLAGKVHRTGAFFSTGSAVPYNTNHHDIATLGQYLKTHPEATADVIAYTDTVGSAASNKRLAERRAAAVADMLIKQGARSSQLRISSVGEAHGPDNSPNQKHRVVKISTKHPNYVDCPNLK